MINDVFISSQHLIRDGCSLPVLPKELKNRLVSADILVLGALRVEVPTRRHPPVNLVLKDLDMLWSGKVALEFLDLVHGLVARCQHGERHLDGGGVLGFDHGRVAGGAGLERVGIARSDEGDDLASPAELWWGSIVVSFY